MRISSSKLNGRIFVLGAHGANGLNQRGKCEGEETAPSVKACCVSMKTELSLQHPLRTGHSSGMHLQPSLGRGTLENQADGYIQWLGKFSQTDGLQVQ